MGSKQIAQQVKYIKVADGHELNEAKVIASVVLKRTIRKRRLIVKDCILWTTIERYGEEFVVIL